MRTPKSTRIQRRFAKIVHAHDALTSATACHRTEKDGVDYSDEERLKMHEAAKLLRQAAEIVSGVYAGVIGKAVVSDIRYERLKP